MRTHRTLRWILLALWIAVIPVACGQGPTPQPSSPVEVAASPLEDQRDPAPPTTAAVPLARLALSGESSWSPPASSSAAGGPCSLASGQAAAFARDLIAAAIQAPTIKANPRVQNASNARTLAMLELALQEEMLQQICAQPWNSSLDAMEGAWLLLGLWGLTDADWSTVSGLIPRIAAQHRLSAEAESWLASPDRRTIAQAFAKAYGNSPAPALLKAAERLLPCPSSQIRLTVVSRSEAEVEGCGRRKRLLDRRNGWGDAAVPVPPSASSARLFP